MGTLYGVDGDLLERQYRNHLSNYLHWDQLAHAENWLLFEKNIGAYVCIDEVALSRGELYTVLINKETHGGKGSIIGIIKGTDVCTVTSVLLKLSRRRRYQVREITLDMAPNMEQIARTCFPAAKRVTDRCHVQKLAYEAVQEMRVKSSLGGFGRRVHTDSLRQDLRKDVSCARFRQWRYKKTVAGKEYLSALQKRISMDSVSKDTGRDSI